MSTLNKKGFTLVEILAVITILSLLMVFVVPNFVKLVNDNKKTVSDIQKEMIINAAKLYVEDCNNIHNTDISCNFTSSGKETKINLDDLVNNGYIEKVVVNDKTCSGTVLKKENNYSVELNC